MPRGSSTLMRFVLVCVMFCAALGYARIAAAEQRVALVIGNDAYPAAPLRNPVNDVRAVAKSLNQLGFDVVLRTNLSQRSMTEAVRDFSSRIKEGDVALFYYSGHGMQVKGRNFLIPVDADIRAEDEVPYLSFDVSQVLDKLEFARTRVNVVILDACRNNPFIRTFRSGRVGLAQMDGPSGTLIAFSTAPGSEARDGDSDYGTYTRYLLAHMVTPGLPIEIVFRRVRESVTAETKDRQIPWESSSLKGDFYFARAIEKPIEVAPAPVAVPQIDPMTIELAFWDSIKSSSNRGDFEAYLDNYPKGTFAGVARNRVRIAEQQIQIAAAQAQAAAKAKADAERKTREAAEIAARAPPPAVEVVRSNAAPPPVAPPRAASAGEVIALVTPSSGSLKTASASSRTLKIGDSWTYQLNDLRFNKLLATLTLEVTGGDADGIRETLRIGGKSKSAANTFLEQRTDALQSAVQRNLALEPRIFEHQLPGGITLFEFAPFITAFAELKPGSQWQSIKGAFSNEPNNEWNFSGRVIGKERIHVIAGDFEAIKVELEGQRGGPVSMSVASNFSTAQDYTAWYVPEIGRVVKYSRKKYNRGRFLLDNEFCELASYNLK